MEKEASNKCVQITKKGTRCTRKAVSGECCTQHSKMVSEKGINKVSGRMITLTFGDCAENHVGMEKIGELRDSGFTYEDLKSFSELELPTGSIEMVDLKKVLMGESVDYENIEPAYLLIVRNGINALLGSEGGDSRLFQEHLALDWDTKAKMYGRVVNKKARHNICYSDYSQEPNYEKGKGRVIDFSEVPLLEQLRSKWESCLGVKAKNLQCEGNYYYDVSKCGIGFHGDSERRVVIGVRVGDPGIEVPLVYQWYHERERVGGPIRISLRSGDVYVMSDKAVGNDWKRKKIYTLRHSAGCDQYTIPKK